METAMEETSVIMPQDRSQKASPSWPGRAWTFYGVLAGVVLIVAGLVAGIWFLDPWHWRLKEDPTAAFHWQEAQKANAERDFDEARKHLLQYLEELPFNAEAHFEMARASRRSLDFRAWRQHLSQAGQLQWPQDQIDFEIQLYQAQTGEVWAVERRLLEALETRPEPEKELILEALAEGYLKNHSLIKVMELTRPWIENSPEDWLPHLYQANVQYVEGTRTKAIEEYRTVLKLNPDQSQAQLRLASSLMGDGQFKEALSRFESYLKENPRDPEGLFGLANCQYSLNQTAAARATLKELLGMAPDFVRALLLQAKVEDADDRPAEALRWLRRAERLAPRESDITHLMILVLQRLNQTEEAEKYITRQQEILNWHEQLIKLRKQLRRADTNADLHYQIGRLNMLLGRDDEAQEWFRRALRLQPSHAEALKALQELDERSGKLTPLPEKSGDPGKK
jgi:tetratricopeptide (TPR) repeat protein